MAYHSWFRYVRYGRGFCIVSDCVLWNTSLVSFVKRLRCHTVQRTVKLLIPTKHIFLRVKYDTRELLMRPSDLLKTGGSPWSLRSAVVSALTKFIT